ncbi:Multiple RNA-binding domain-containing protein 1 [Penicillium canariense]|uniref:Multiple RNA-binding domain-containing protein 1 n=1 Tax=Penicillium canariense TaxID=189055 RepID=A0A9W9LI37_9EURO|nr:Multiple RNA-binding domain-containing protein 1 [Penicillium canariense]KAJ5157064.1 Multiple RNA-binding domain-containing protein 1 [Penicillium canariense]
MENTRVFVSGLPPSCSNDQLRNHFATRFAVTDAHVLPKRRMGFVGFKSNEVAKEAVSYFNRTYMKMSKISVDLARPIGSNPTEHAHPTRKRDAADDISPDNGLKRKRDADAKSQDPKLQEYLALMQNSSKTRTWANDDSTAMAQASEQPEVTINKPTQDDNTKEEFSSQPKKVRVQEPVTDDNAEQPQPMEVDKSGEDEDRDTSAQEDAEVAEAAEAESGPVSDADWLRSKTSRLLGLLDEDEQAEFEQHKDTEPAESRSPSKEESRTAAFEKDAPQVATNDEDSVEDVVEPTPEQPDTNVDLIRDSARLFLRNLAYDTTDADLQPLFAPFGKLDEVHVAFDTRTETSKGFAYIQYANADAAVEAYRALDGKHFQGRLLHVLPAAAKKTYKIDDIELSKLPLKKQKQIKRKMGATSSAFSWNSLYMNADAVMSSVAERLGVTKADLLDPTSSDAAVKQAHAETHVIQETKAYFASNGVNIEAFKGHERGNTAILVKNFSFGVKSAELRSLFEPYGQILRLLMPPSGTIAIVEFARPDQAQSAFKGLAYRKIGDSILFLEKAPKNLFDGTATAITLPEAQVKSQGFSTSDTFAAEEAETGVTSTLFVKNLNFSTTNEKFLETFRPLEGFVTGRIKTKPDPKRPGQTLSMGFGFAEFRTKAQAQAALAAMNGYKLDQHELVIRASHKAMDAAEERRREDTAKKIAARRTKIIIKNLPFQTTKKDIRSLFGAYGQLRSVRLPQKFDRSARGFGFADFISAREAENAMDALKNTHLLGRRLVLEFANEEAVDPEEEIAKIEKKVGEQVDRVKLQQLTGGGRKKFTVGGEEDEA